MWCFGMIDGTGKGVSLPGNCVVQFGGLLFPKPAIPGCGGLVSNSEITSNDVLLDGSGSYGDIHPGNIQFRAIISQQKKNYLEYSSKQMPKLSISVMDVAARVVDIVRRLDPPGRFLKKDEISGYWNEIGDERARGNAALALADYVPVDRAKKDEKSGYWKEISDERSRGNTARALIDYKPVDRVKISQPSDQLPQHLEAASWLERKQHNCAAIEYEHRVQHCKQPTIPSSCEESSFNLEDIRLPEVYAKFQGKNY